MYFIFAPTNDWNPDIAVYDLRVLQINKRRWKLEEKRWPSVILSGGYYLV